VAVREGVLGPENGTDLEDTVQVAHDAHLLIKLRTLRQTAILVKVLQLEHVAAAFRGAFYQLWCVNLRKPVFQEEAPEQLADAALDPEDGLLTRGTQVYDAIVEPRLHLDYAADRLCLVLSGFGVLERLLFLLLLLVLTFQVPLQLLLGDWSARVLQLEGQHREAPADHEDPLDN